VAPSTSGFLQIIYGQQNTRAQVIGSTTDYQTAYNLVVADGDFFTQDEYDNAEHVAVIGPNVATPLFGTDEPVGQVIRMGNSVATVVGVLASKGQSFGSTDNAVLIPLTAMQELCVQFAHLSRPA